MLKNCTETLKKTSYLESLVPKNDLRGGRLTCEFQRLFHLKIHLYRDACRLPTTRSIKGSTPGIRLTGVVT